MIQTPSLTAKWASLSREEFERERFNRLRTFLAEQLYPFSQHYRAFLDLHEIRPDSIRTPSDLARIPFTTKREMSPTDDDPARPTRFILKPTAASILEAWPVSKRLGLLMQKVAHGSESLQKSLGQEYRPVLLTFTTGRSAAPIPFAYSLYDLELLRASGERLIEMLGVDPARGTGIDLFPYAPHLAFWQTVFAGFASASLLFHTGGGKMMGTEAIVAAIRKMKPVTMMGIPGYVYHCLRACEAAGADLSALERIVLGGDAAPAGLRAKLAELAGRCGAKASKVQAVYGFTEARLCWAECPSGEPGSEPSGYHIYPDLGYVEIVDPQTGKPVKDGETGEIVYSSTDGRGSCVLRYRTGDIAEGGLRWGTCPSCGRTTPRVGPTLRRVSNVQDIR
ncbi:MAG: AMP-binding protein, partial [Planctomycetes bacterium]|nr:AMP-binding protein [Planctomycetota bacterium]